MVLTESHGTEKMRTSIFSGILKGFADPMYKFKQALVIDSTSGWKNFFWRKDPDPLTDVATTEGTLAPIKGIPRGAAFPQAAQTFERVMSVIEKYGLEDTIPYEDLISDDVDVRNRTLIDIAAGVTKSVDDEIWDRLTEGRNPASIQTVTIPVGKFWSSPDGSGAIMDDLAQCKQLISEKNYPTDNLLCFVSPKDARSILNYLYEKGAQAPAIGTQIVRNGSIGKVGPVTLIESNSVSASYALVVVPKRVGTWKQLVPLTTITKEDPLRSLTIRTAELGVTQLTDPKAAVLIIGTQSNM